MRRFLTPALWLIAPLALLVGVSRAPAASFGVRDNAHFFSADAIKQAEQSIQQIQQRHNKDLLIETFPAVPDELRDRLAQQGKDAFFSSWTKQRAAQQGVNGVYVLIVKSPGHLEVWDGNKTQQHLFPESAADQLRGQLLAAFRNKQYDQGLIQAARFVQDTMDANGQPAGNGAAASPPSGRGAPGYPSFPTRVNRPSWGIGSIACVVIGVVLVILLVRGIFGRSGSSYGGGYYPPGGYPQGGYPPAGYPPAGGYYGGGGGGFGRGFLGGLLGGALGGYAADRIMHPNQGQTGGGYVPPATGGGDFGGGVDTGGTTSGGDFGASDASSGGDFGSSGGGDFGGGGGSDFGGGGDAGSSSGGDF